MFHFFLFHSSFARPSEKNIPKDKMELVGALGGALSSLSSGGVAGTGAGARGGEGPGEKLHGVMSCGAR